MAATRTYLGPLTTTFTAPSTCTELMLASADPTEGFFAQSCSSGLMGDDASCWPSAMSGVSTPTPMLGFGVYSPGLVCPSGYATACSTTSGGAGDFNFQFPLDSGETAVGCCPSGYGCYHLTIGAGIVAGVTGTVVQTCTSSATTGSFVAGRCDGGGGSVVSTHTVSTAMWVHAPLMQLAWQASDLASVTETSSSTPVVTSTPTSTPSLSTSSSTGTGSSASGLSPGAGAGIGVAAGLVAVGIIALVVWVLLKRRKSHDSPGTVGVDTDLRYHDGYDARAELDSQGQRYELSDPKFRETHVGTHELQDPRYTHELAG